jgi:hypothetical protein
MWLIAARVLVKLISAGQPVCCHELINSARVLVAVNLLRVTRPTVTRPAHRQPPRASPRSPPKSRQIWRNAAVTSKRCHSNTGCHLHMQVVSFLHGPEYSTAAD